MVLANPHLVEKSEQKFSRTSHKTSETAYLFFSISKNSETGGRCGVVIKNTFLSNTDNASIALRKQLLEECNFFAVLDLPGGAFIGTGVKTVVLFLKREANRQGLVLPVNVGRNMGKTNPLMKRIWLNLLRCPKHKSSAKIAGL